MFSLNIKQILKVKLDIGQFSDNFFVNYLENI